MPRLSRAVLVAAAPFLALTLLPGRPGEARDCRATLIPNGSRFSCSNCHLSAFGGGPRNPFGEAVRPLVGIFCNGFWSPQLAALDSDGDGKTNGAELGDPQGAWRPGQPNPGTPALVTNPGIQPFIRGDFNVDGKVDVSDAVGILEFLFRGGAPPACRASADANNDLFNTIDVADALRVLLHLFAEGVNPPAPFPGCGNGADDNDCRTYDACG